MKRISLGRKALALLLLLPLTGCEPAGPPTEASPEAGTTPTAVGRLVIVGGRLQSDNLPVYESILSGREGGGPLCIIPTASGTPRESMEAYVAVFDSIGGAGTAHGIFLPVEDTGRARDPAVAQEIRGCGGFFFTGGSQSRIVSLFRPQGEGTPIFEAVWERFGEGAVVSGSSAGAAIMSDPMISGGGSVAALEHGLAAGDDGEGVRLQDGMGFLEEGLVDQHFLARGRWGRLFVATLNSGDHAVGFGIDENTALVVEGDSAWVVGESGVVFMDAREAALEEGGTGGYGVRLFLLGEGDGVHLSTGEVRPDPSKAPLPSAGAFVEESELDLFSPWTFLRVLSALGPAADNRVIFHQDGYLIEIRKEPAFQALSLEGLGVQNTPSSLSLGPFVLSVWRE